MGPSPTARKSPTTRGIDVVTHLLASAALDLKLARSLIEVSQRADLTTYLEGKGIGAAPGWLESLISAEMAGGVFARRNLPERLRRQLPDLSKSQIFQIAAEITALNVQRKKDFNYVRYTVNAVNSVFASLQRRDLFEIPGLSLAEKRRLEGERERLLTQEIPSPSLLDAWIEDVISIHHEISSYLEGDEESDQAPQVSIEILKAKKKKGFVSTKSLSTYRLRVKDYAQFEAAKLFSDQSLTYQSDLQLLLEKYNDYKELSKTQIERFLEENQDRIATSVNEFRKELSEETSNNKSQEALISTKVELSANKILQVRYSGNSIDPQLIRPILNSLRSQLILADEKAHLTAEARNGTAYLSVDINQMKKTDLEKIEIFLSGMASSV